MHSLNHFKDSILNINADSFEELSLEIFNFQVKANKIYGEYADSLGIVVDEVVSIDQIPFLPIEFFKSYDIKSGNWLPEKTFLSSGTTSAARSKHLIEDETFYRGICKSIFESFYGPLSESTILALLPSYQQQGNSGLINMVDFFIKESKTEHSGYFLNDYAKLEEAIDEELRNDRNVVLFGVSFALLEFSRYAGRNLKGLKVVETGGMKGRGREYTKEELHAVLKEGLGVDIVHSEYGMTELMSQAYSGGEGRFDTPDWMRIVIREMNDPFNYLQDGKTGGINVIDLANVHSCSFIETKDIGIVRQDGKFEILGRIDNSDLRGCNLLVT